MTLLHVLIAAVIVGSLVGYGFLVGRYHGRRQGVEEAREAWTDAVAEKVERERRLAREKALGDAAEIATDVAQGYMRSGEANRDRCVGALKCAEKIRERAVL